MPSAGNAFSSSLFSTVYAFSFSALWEVGGSDERVGPGVATALVRTLYIPPDVFMVKVGEVTVAVPTVCPGTTQGVPVLPHSSRLSMQVTVGTPCKVTATICAVTMVDACTTYGPLPVFLNAMGDGVVSADTKVTVLRGRKQRLPFNSLPLSVVFPVTESRGTSGVFTVEDVITAVPTTDPAFSM